MVNGAPVLVAAIQWGDVPSGFSALVTLAALVFAVVAVVVFILAASGAVVLARHSGVNFAVSSVPPFQDGSPSTPFLSVNGFYVASRGENKIVAVDLVPDYLTRSDVTESFGRLAHVVPLRLTKECDPAVAAFHALCPRAMPLPSFPQVGDVLGLMGAAELRLIAGEDAAVVADDLAERVRALF